MSAVVIAATIYAFCTLVRYWGWTENEREAALYRRYMQKRIDRGEAPHGESVLSEHMQNLAVSNSQYAALKFGKLLIGRYS
jgi:hypothetical protein